MGRIEFTNIVIDDFSLARRDPKQQYTHILTHIHTGTSTLTQVHKHQYRQSQRQPDHLKGLSDSWNYGIIYCTTITKQLVLLKYPSLEPLMCQIQVQMPTTLQMTSQLSVTITFFDANHCPGAVLVLIQGYMGTVLYTGDMRFDRQIFENYNYLYPPQKRNAAFEGCSKQIDLLYLDNTFLKKKFSFPPKDQVYQMLLEFVRQTLINQGNCLITKVSLLSVRYVIQLNKHSKILIGLDLYGKQQTIDRLAQQLNIYVVVEDSRYEILKAMNKDLTRYTTNFDVGIIQVVNKRRLCQTLQQQPQAIGIILSGWVNTPTYRYHNRIYCLPYSLHSNYRQIQAFVNSVRPSRIYPIVQHFPQQDKIFYADQRASNKEQGQTELSSGKATYTQELQQLRKKYCCLPSQEYRELIQSVQLQKRIMEMLKPPKMADFQSNDKQMMPVHFQTVQRKKYKLNGLRNEQEINRIKNIVKMKRHLQQGAAIEIINPSQDQAVLDINHQVDQPYYRPPPSIEMDCPQLTQIDPFNPPLRDKTKLFLQNKEKHKLTLENKKSDQSTKKGRRVRKSQQKQQNSLSWMKKMIEGDQPYDVQSICSSGQEQARKERSRSRDKKIIDREQQSYTKKRRFQPRQCQYIDLDLDSVEQIQIVKDQQTIKNFIQENEQKLVYTPKQGRKSESLSQNINDLD